MKKIRSIIQFNMVGAILLIAGTTTVSAISFTETFDSAANGWTGVRNSGTFGQNNDIPYSFGFSSSDNTAGLSGAGEAGGIFPSNTGIVYYGISLGQNFDLSSTFHADGEFSIKGYSTNTLNNNVQIGFFNSATVTANAPTITARTNMIGMSLNEPGANGVRAKASFAFTDGVRVESASSLTSGSGTRQLTTSFTFGRFSIDYNPATTNLAYRVYDSNGTQIGNNSSLTLNPTQAARGLSVDSFGILTGGVFAGAGSFQDAQFEVYMDNVNVSAIAVPEPGTFALAGLGAAMALGGRWITRRQRK